VCTYRNSQIPILATDCDTCTCFEFQPPLDALHEDTPALPRRGALDRDARDR
jgi:hypothetical protein